jgi:hypothetical protein
MAEELRFFLRPAMYALAISIVYWFVSYEVAGTLLLVFLAVGCAIFVVSMTAAVTATRLFPTDVPLGWIGRVVMGFVGFDPPDKPGPQPLELEEGPLPEGSIWPICAAGAAVLVAVGLIFGGWFWIPGVALGLAVVGGWATQLR